MNTACLRGVACELHGSEWLDRVVSREELNRGGRCPAVPVTTSRVAERRRYANYVFLQSGTGGCVPTPWPSATWFLVQPVRALFLKERWAKVSALTLAQVVAAIAWSVGLIDAP